MDFEEWIDGIEANNYDDIICAMGDAFKAGQQSKQEKIDALKAKLEEVENHAFTNYDHERDDDHHSYWSGYNVAIGEFVDIIKGEPK